ncbi:MAG: hypothetical protein QOK28_171 [Actinomycetota bacterium]|jgi:hypothetical protein
MLTPAERKQTIASIAELQLDNGMIEWFPGGHADPWNHVEAAMALAIGGYRDQADAAYHWLANLQHDDGSWCSYYLAGDRVEDPRRDTNVSLYVATGLWHHLRIFEDRAFVAETFPMLERAVEFALSLQEPSGVLLWSLEPPHYGLLTGSSSAAFSLRCAIGLAESIGADRPAWKRAAGRLAHAVAHCPDAFEPKEPWAMDWYYPVLCGAVGGAAGRARLAERWDEFTHDQRGVRCVSDSAWITAAETAECSLAHLAVGERTKAEWLLDQTRHLRDTDGSYWTGIALNEGVHFPADERSSYTAAAVVLADDALSEESPAWDIFTGDEQLPPFACA